MFPMPIIGNTSIAPPQPMTFINPDDIHVYPGPSDAIPNTDYVLSDTGAKLTIKRPNTLNTYVFYNGVDNNLLGRNVYFRFKFDSAFSLIHFYALHLNTVVISSRTLSNNTWHSIRVVYGETETSEHMWYLNDIVIYTGTKIAAPYFYYSCTTSDGIVLFDNGQYGGTLPSGAEWWPNSTM